MKAPRRLAKGSGRTDRRVWVVAAIAAVVLIGGAGIVVWRLTTSDPSNTTTDRTVEVTAQTIRQTVGTTGTVEPKRRADLSFSSAGTVSKIWVGVGQHVAAHQRLASIDTASLKADVDAAEADYQAAKDDLAAAEDDSATTGAQLNAAKSKVAVQKSQLAQAKRALAAATLRAPFAGTVALVNVAAGDTVGSSSGSGQGSSGSSGSTAAVTVISTGSYTVQASVGSADVGKVKKGMAATITVSGSTTVLRGTVSSVAVMATSSSGSVSGSTGANGTGTGSGGSGGTGGSPTFAVAIDLTGNQRGLYAGASATVSIVVGQRSNVLTVPTIAIRTVGGKTVVTKLVGGRGVQTEISVGESFGAFTEVTKGLVAGDQVVISLPSRTNSAGSASASGQRRFGGGGFPGGGLGRQGNQSGGAGQGGSAGQGGGAGQPGGGQTGGTP